MAQYPVTANVHFIQAEEVEEYEGFYEDEEEEEIIYHPPPTPVMQHLAHFYLSGHTYCPGDDLLCC